MRIRRGIQFWPWVVALALIPIAWLTFVAIGEAQQNKVAVVNASVITQEDFDNEMSRIQRQLLSMGKPPTDSQLSAIRKQVLENLINVELLYQQSQKEGIKVDEAAINQQLSTLKGRFTSEAEFTAALGKMNMSEAALKSRLKREMAIQQFIEKEFAQKVTVSEEEIKAYYDGHPDSFKQPEQVQASHILIKVDPQMDESQKAEARKKLEGVKQKLQKGEDFVSLAKEFSQCPSSSKGGDLGYFRRGQMVKPFEEAAFALKPGEVSDIVETRFGYHLIKVIDKKPETTIAYHLVKDRLEHHLKEKKVQEEAGLYAEKLKENAKVERFLSVESKPD
jgi:peptidyl-prolyl cis-trans isomerase C